MTLFKRSGLAVHKIAEYIGWKPETIYQVGVGQNHQETEVMQGEWPDVKIFGAEPHPKIIESVQDRYPGKLFPVAISDYEGEATLYSKSSHKDGSSLYPHNKHPNDNTITVPVTTVDKLWSNGPEKLPCLFWLDCEGSEYPALCGAEEFVKKVDVINIEITGGNLGVGRSDPKLIHLWIKNHGFRRQWTHTQRAHIGQCDVIYVRPHLFRADICCCQCELCDERYS